LCTLKQATVKLAIVAQTPLWEQKELV
jgi:hypothetical protein